MGPIRTPVVERIARARESARLLEGRVVDPRLASDLDRTLAALDELESAASASAAESQAETPKSLEEQREILEMLRFDLELLNEDVKELQRFLAVQSRFSSAVPRGLGFKCRPPGVSPDSLAERHRCLRCSKPPSRRARAMAAPLPSSASQVSASHGCPGRS